MPGKQNKRRLFLEQLGKDLVTPFITRRERIPRTEASGPSRAAAALLGANHLFLTTTVYFSRKSKFLDGKRVNLVSVITLRTGQDQVSELYVSITHIVLRRTSLCGGSHHRAAHIILRRTSSFSTHHLAAHHLAPHIITAHHREAHIILRRTSSCGAHHPAEHMGGHLPEAHIIVRRTSSCGALHPAAHIVLRAAGDVRIVRRTQGKICR
ncbi:unnamed protein product [Pleuronectes platessa]|uniref:Uncharacterized protein n=1 Tax=Pleuronectes platessa TaxID=8262 RepID=A0A9N7V3I3_PLEPL|nr:unnamed protein product [Pleuronectes platessa]